jgi:hypothetical protein
MNGIRCMIFSYSIQSARFIWPEDPRRNKTRTSASNSQTLDPATSCYSTPYAFSDRSRAIDGGRKRFLQVWKVGRRYESYFNVPLPTELICHCSNSKIRLAANRDPIDSAPLRNLSATYYEIGNYRQCITSAEQALKLVVSADGNDVHIYKEKLQGRIGKASDMPRRLPAEEKTKTRIKILETLVRYRLSM